MNPTTLSQWQFGITIVYHFFFVPLTLGLAFFVALVETFYVRTGNEVYKRMAKFWGKLFLINFAMGVVTGIVMEFQFGMNWSEYSRFVGDIFGTPLAIDGLLAFFLESTFLGVWIFGWEKLSKGMHAAAMWLVAIGTNISALWILSANSWMQHPVGYTIEGGRAVMTKFGELLANPYLWGQFPHTVFSGLTTGMFFILGVSAYHLFRKKDDDLFLKSFKLASIIGLIAILGVIGVGDQQTKKMFKYQPMKIAAAEGLVETQNPAGLALIAIVDEEKLEEVFSIRIPRALSFLVYTRFDGEVKGMRDIQAEYEVKYGKGEIYYPTIFITFWTFRIMVGLGFLMLGIVGIFLLSVIIKRPVTKLPLFKFYPAIILLPFLANTSGWLLTEMGRQPWIVFGLMKTSQAASPSVSTGEVLISLIGFTLIYGLLMVVDIYLLVKYARRGSDPTPVLAESDVETETELQ